MTEVDKKRIESKLGRKLTRQEIDILDLKKTGGSEKDFVFLEKANAILDSLERIEKKPSPEFPDIPQPEKILFPETQKIEGEVSISNLNEIAQFDLQPIVKAIEKIKLEKTEQTDYTLMLDEMMKIMERPKDNTQLIKIQELIEKINIPDNKEIVDLLTQLLEKNFPEFNFDKDGRLKVSVDRVGGGGVAPLLPLLDIDYATEDKQDDIIANTAYPTGTGDNGSVTLTNSATSYAVPATASTIDHVLILYNGSDTDMYWGFENSNANGILLPAGGIATLDLGASQQVYVYCASALKIITYSFKNITA